MVLSKSYAKPLCMTIALFVAPVVPKLAVAQPGCDVSQLPREAVGGSRLGIKTDEDWRFYLPNDGSSAHELETGGLQNLCVAWEAPPYERSSRQIVYSSTRYREDQPLWLFRNSAAAQIPFVGRLVGDWSRLPDRSGTDPVEAFREFHGTLPADIEDTRWSHFVAWHDTSVWRANRSSHELVSSAMADAPLLPFGTERLLVLAPRRPLTSWIRIDSRAPSTQGEFRIAVAFSGDLESRGPHVYQYVFEVR